MAGCQGRQTLEHMASEVCHDQGDSQGDQVQGPVSSPMATLPSPCLPGNVLHQVGQGCQGDTEADGVRKGLRPRRRCDSQESRQQERPASAAHCTINAVSQPSA